MRSTTSRRELAVKLARVHAYLTEHLIPHATAEEKGLYPAANQAMGSPRQPTP